MSKLIPLTQLNIENFIELLRDSELLVYENIQGSKIFFRYDGNNIIIKARSLNSDPINRVDLALQKYYQPVWSYLEGLDERIKKLIPKNWWFSCLFFFDEQPSHIKYDKLPKNKLILTSIVKNGKFTYDYNEIGEYSNLLDINSQPIIFKGILTEKQLEVIQYFLNTTPNDLEYIFGENNFSHFFYKILSPQITSSNLMDDGKFQLNIEKLIIRINGNEEIAFSILNPLYKQVQSSDSEHVDVYTILLVEFLEFLQIASFEKTPLKSTTSDELYLELLSILFNAYCKNRESKIDNFTFDIPLFFKSDKYKINTDLVQNTKTQYWISKSPKLEYFFKIILSSFRQKKKKPIGVFNDITLKIFNDNVEKISSTIDKKMKVERELSIDKDKLMSFDDFYEIQYSSDAEGKVYPDLWRDLSNDGNTINKKSKK